jgi:LacI family transcriptional regulator
MKTITLANAKITDVAREAGLSVATVSRVLNQQDIVSAASRQRVLEAIERLGYRPNLLAGHLRRKQTRTLGVVISDIMNPHFTEMVRAVEDAAYRSGYRVLLCNTDESSEKEADYLQLLSAERTGGVIASPSDPADSEFARLLDLGIPVVAIDRPLADERAHSVLSDNAGAAALATRHLLAAGHEVVGLVAGPEHRFTGRERTRGYLDAMREAGREPRLALGDFQIDGGRRATRELLDGPRPTALVVANNLMTIGALEVLNDSGVRLPQDMALVAIDDPFWATAVHPRLTTLAQPVEAMAEAAVTLLTQRDQDAEGGPRHETFQFELHVRDSCGTRQGR